VRAEVASPEQSLTILEPELLFDGCGGPPKRDMAVLLEDNVIREVVPKDSLSLPRDGPCRRLEFPGATLLPGLIDCHTHANMPADGRSGEDVIPDGDDIRLLRSARNVQLALEAGVTTLCDCGAWNRTAFSLKEAIAQGVVEGPRLLVCGRPVTITRGHCWFMGGEADGVGGVREATRRLVNEGADFIKVMATGGSTSTSDPFSPAYTTEELGAVAREAHERGRVVAAHCRCIEGMVNVLGAELDIIVHGIFAGRDGTRKFDPRIAERMARQATWVNPTLHISRARVCHMEQREASLSAEERALLDQARRSYRDSLEECGQLIEAGVRLVAGSDCGWDLCAFGSTAHEVGALAEAGLSPSQALLAGTRNGAEALRILDRVGTVEVGKEADLLVVEGDPTRDIDALTRVVAVFKGGRRVGGRAS